MTIEQAPSESDSDLYPEHLKTWHGFTRAAVYATGSVVLTLILLALFLL